MARHAVEPVADQGPGPDGGGLGSQDEEGGLESVLGVVVVAQHAPAHAQHHGTVAPDQGFKGGLLAADEETFQ